MLNSVVDALQATTALMAETSAQKNY